MTKIRDQRTEKRCRVHKAWIGRRIQLRHTPEIVFELDNSIERGVYINKLINETLQENREKRMLKKIAEAIAKAGSIAILPHIAADGDAIGSSLALAIGLS